MSEYFLKLPGDSQPRAYSEYEVREFLGQGVIDSKTLTWKQGMDCLLYTSDAADEL